MYLFYMTYPFKNFNGREYTEYIFSSGLNSWIRCVLWASLFFCRCFIWKLNSIINAAGSEICWLFMFWKDCQHCRLNQVQRYKRVSESLAFRQFSHQQTFKGKPHVYNFFRKGKIKSQRRKQTAQCSEYSDKQEIVRKKRNSVLIKELP